MHCKRPFSKVQHHAKKSINQVETWHFFMCEGKPSRSWIYCISNYLPAQAREELGWNTTQTPDGKGRPCMWHNRVWTLWLSFWIVLNFKNCMSQGSNGVEKICSCWTFPYDVLTFRVWLDLQILDAINNTHYVCRKKDDDVPAKPCNNFFSLWKSVAAFTLKMAKIFEGSHYFVKYDIDNDRVWFCYDG